MAQHDPAPRPCRACRGRGWKFLRSRRAVVLGTLARGSALAARRICPECGGSGVAR